MQLAKINAAVMLFRQNIDIAAGSNTIILALKKSWNVLWQQTIFEQDNGWYYNFVIHKS